MSTNKDDYVSETVYVAMEVSGIVGIPTIQQSSSFNGVLFVILQ